MKQLFSAFLIGIIICFFAMKSCDDKPKQINIKDVKREIKASGKLAEAIHYNYQKEEQQFIKVADSLKTENEKLTVKLKVARALLKKQQAVVVSSIPCDTLRKKVVVMNELTNVQDSLCSLSINTLNEAVAIRDSQIVICNNSYASIFDLQKQNQIRQEQLTKELNTSYKHSKRKRMENKMLSFGLMVMTGITTTLFIKSQQ